MRYMVRPISDWTAFAGDEPRNSPFTVTWSQCQDLLDRELFYLDAEDIALELDVAERQIRLDGTLRADASVTSPAVRLAFDSNQGPLTYATDRFVRPSYRRHGMQRDWQHNLYAIAKGLEALRLVDRYEITRRGEQYAGFKALPAGRAMPASHMTRDQAEAVLTKVTGPVDRPLDTRIRLAQAAAHPDRHDGDRTLWDQVEQAARLLGAGS